MSGRWPNVSKRNPCPACGKPDWCAWAKSGMLKCERTSVPPSGMKVVSLKGNGAVFAYTDGPGRPRARRPRWADAAPKAVQEPKTAPKPRPTPEEALAAYCRLGTPSASWDYHDEGGTVVFKALRFEQKPDPTNPSAKPKKTFRPVALVPGGWIPGDPPGKLPLYGLPALRAVPQGGLIVVTEGEKNADRAGTLGWVATTSAHGAQSAEKSDWSPVRGLHVVVFVDHDKDGETYGQAVTALALAAGALSVRIVRLAELWPEMPKGGDLVDFSDYRGRDPKLIRREVEALMDRSELVTASNEGPEPQPPEFLPVSALQLVRTYVEMRPVVIEGLVRAGEVINIVAPPKIGKTWLAHSMAAAVVAGEPWLGKQTVRGCVLLIDGELHQETLSDRMRRVQARYRLTDEAMDRLMVFGARGQMLDVDQIAEMLMKVEPGQYALVLLDALYRFLPSNMEENANESMMYIYNCLDAMAMRTGAAIGVVHHSSKGSQADKAVTDVGSGAGAQSRAADTHLILREHEVPGAAVVEAVVRSFKPMEPFVIRSTNPGWELAPDLDPSKLKKRGRAGKDKGSPGRGEAGGAGNVAEWTPQRFASEVVRDGLMIKEELIAHAKGKFDISKTSAESLLKRAESASLVFRYQKGPSDLIRFSTKSPRGSTKTPPSRSSGRGRGAGSAVPLTPGADAPGGVGGTRNPPPPPSTGRHEKSKKKQVKGAGKARPNCQIADQLGGAA